MLGVSLLYVGAVLMCNGLGRLTGIDGKSVAVIDFFVGFLSVFINLLSIIQGDYYSAATGLLFGFTYLFIALNAVFNLDGRVLGWFSLFVAVTAVPCAVLCLTRDNDPIFFVIWLLWALLWFAIFLESVLNKNLGKFVPVLLVLEGIVTGWIPGFLLLTGVL